MRVAAVDVGTNSVRLLVAEPGGPGEPLVEVMRETRITRLGKGIDAGGHFDAAALSRTLDCLADYAVRWRELGAERVRLTATSAVRDADDRERFFTGVRERTGVEAELLSGEQEALTAFRGATSAVAAEPPCCVLDIGGGSTELILGDGERVSWTSRQLGCVRLTEQALHSDPPTQDQVAEARRIADAEVAAAATIVDAAGARTLIGVAGTVTTLAALHLDLATYDATRIHGTRVPLASVEALILRLAAMTAAQRAALGPMASGREDVILGGALILAAVMRRFTFGEVLVSEADILDGLLLLGIGG